MSVSLLLYHAMIENVMYFSYNCNFVIINIWYKHCYATCGRSHEESQEGSTREHWGHLACLHPTCGTLWGHPSRRWGRDRLHLDLSWLPWRTPTSSHQGWTPALEGSGGFRQKWGGRPQNTAAGWVLCLPPSWFPPPLWPSHHRPRPVSLTLCGPRCAWLRCAGCLCTSGHPPRWTSVWPEPPPAWEGLWRPPPAAAPGHVSQWSAFTERGGQSEIMVCESCNQAGRGDSWQCRTF